MVNFLDHSQLRNKIASGFKGKLPIGVLYRTVYGEQDERGNPKTSEITYRVQGFIDNYNSYYRSQAGIPEGDVRIIIIAGNSDVDPIKDDEVKIPNFPRYKIRQVSTDPGQAHYDCQAFKVK